MKQTRKGKRQSRKVDGVATQPTFAHPRARSREIVRDLLKGLLFITLVLGLKLIVERTELGHQLHLMSYNLLQQKLAPEQVPITVVDIGELQPDHLEATPREPLRRLIEAITEHDPKAIGIDVDFSPVDGVMHPDDAEFFRFCLDIMKQRGVKIFLGIWRTTSRPASEWLGDEQYESLAANIQIPKDTKRMLSEIRVEGVKPSQSMSAALAQAFESEQDDPTTWRSQVREALNRRVERIGLIEQKSEQRLGPQVVVEQFLVDFSALDSIKPLYTTDPGFIRNPNNRERFEGKIVLLGAQKDPHVVAVRQQTYPGVFLHACATYTLIHAPLYEVTTIGSLAIDVVFLMAILFTLTLMRLYYANRRSDEVAVHRLQGLLTLAVVVGAIVIGVLFVKVTRVMWHDFFLALTAIIFHPAIERHLESFWRQIRKFAPAVYHSLVFKESKEPRQ